ncbi:unnamed protein product [Nyctereutes procyonoides]|uniref:(raccoon dog) hypothetical protein n=1 Tax=Nyctereutes procyonoides TaxID=34880 RepID=A0A811Z3C2_NYCPR|nr:unnamed protein product [Nyctereutes procyonoides]
MHGSPSRGRGAVQLPGPAPRSHCFPDMRIMDVCPDWSPTASCSSAPGPQVTPAQGLNRGAGAPDPGQLFRDVGLRTGPTLPPWWGGGAGGRAVQAPRPGEPVPDGGSAVARSGTGRTSAHHGALQTTPCPAEAPLLHGARLSSEPQCGERLSRKPSRLCDATPGKQGLDFTPSVAAEAVEQPLDARSTAQPQEERLGQRTGIRKPRCRHRTNRPHRPPWAPRPPSSHCSRGRRCPPGTSTERPELSLRALGLCGTSYGSASAFQGNHGYPRESTTTGGSWRNEVTNGRSPSRGILHSHPGAALLLLLLLLGRVRRGPRGVWMPGARCPGANTQDGPRESQSLPNTFAP